MSYRQHTDHCFNASFTPARHSELLARLTPALADLQARKNTRATPLIDIALARDDLDNLQKLAQDVRAKFSHVVIVGAGGSGLSGRTLCALRPPVAPVMHFLENIDPDAIDDLLARLELAKTLFIVISKSGSTAETLGHFYVLHEAMEKALGKKASEHFIVITQQTDSPLRQSAQEKNIRLLDFPATIGGRFSILTNVGLLPAAIAGLDIKALREGAAAVVREMDGAKTPADCKPAIGAALQYGLAQAGCNISVMLPYGERLGGFSSWYRQCWAESLGKGGKGSTPICAVGTTDQHSQLQLYLGGPKDKLFHLITAARKHTGQHFTVPNHPELAYLRGKTTGDIMEAEQKATFDTLVKNGCPVRLFELETLGEKELGALLMHFTLEIIFTAHLQGCDPFDQPAVEEGKELARDSLLSGKL